MCNHCFEEIKQCEKCCDELTSNEPVYCGTFEHYCE